MTRSFLITAAPPNPNGDLHLGHLSGPFLGADVLRRYLRRRGHRTLYVSYTDDWSCYVLRKAEELGRPPRETAYTYGQRMVETLSLANMLPDYYEHPFREPVHEQTVHQIFARLHEHGAFTEAETPAFHCERCERYLYEAYVRGRCQHCGAPSDGFYCEECAKPQDPAGLRQAACIRCRRAPRVRSVGRLLFPLDRYGERLREYYGDRPWRPRLRAYLDAMLAEGLPPTPVSRRTPYGVGVPLGDAWDGHILDTWYSGISGYIAATRAYGDAVGNADLWRELWQDPQTHIVQFIGFDCSFSHAVLWPALLMAHGGFTLPEHVITNEFYRLEGEKFSTSRGHAIWGSDLLRRVPADAVRFYLCLTNPEHEQTSFGMSEFTATVDEALAGDLETWTAGVLARLREDFGGALPDADGAAPPEALRVLRRELPDRVAACLEPAEFSLRGAAAAVLDAVQTAAGQFRDLGGSGAGDGAAYRAALNGHLELLAALALAAEPLMPGWAAHVWRSLDMPVALAEAGWPDAGRPLLAAGQRIAGGASRLFHPL